jgi:hypothetical protein
MRSLTPRRPLGQGQAPVADQTGMGFWQLSFYLVLGLTLLRLAFLRASPLELQPGEPERWLWSQTLALGYGDNATVPVWLAAASTAFCGVGEACIRATSPLLQAGTAILLGAAGVALGSWTLGAWSMLLCATLPGVAIASLWLGADSPLMFFWAAALYAVLRLRQGHGLGWAILGGFALGLGILSSNAMLLFPLGGALYLLLSREGRRALGVIRPGVMLLILLLIVTVHHIWRLPAEALRPPPTPSGSRGFPALLIWQIIIFGPVPLYLLFRQLLSWRASAATAGAVLGQEDHLLLLCLSLPVILAFLVSSLAGWGNAGSLAYDPGAAAVAYVAASILAVDRALAGPAARWLRGSVIAHAAIGFALYALIWVTPQWHAAPRPLAEAVARFSGWHALGRAVTAELTRQMPPPRLLLDGRLPVSLLLYYAEVAPGEYVMWQDAGRRLRPGDPGPFLLVAPGGQKSDIPSHFAQLQSAGNVVIPLATGELRRFDLDRLAGFRGGQP